MSDRSQTGAEAVSTTIGMIGAGRLGTALALALERAGYLIGCVASANRDDAHTLAQRLATAVAFEVQELPSRCELVFLSVPDDALPELARVLPWTRGQEVVHTSGALDLSVLEPA